MQSIPDALLAAVADRYRVAARHAEPLRGGTASEVWRLDSNPPLVVRLSRYLTLDDLHRSCGLATAFSRAVPEAIGPLAGSDGEPAFVWNGRPISVWPYVDGIPVDRHDPDQRAQAARLLARLHRATLAFPRPDDGRSTSLSEPGPETEDEPGPETEDDARTARLIADPELDEWLRRWRTGGSTGEPIGWMHHDFFPGNVLCHEGTLVGLVDWDEVAWGPLITELAWSIWEFGKSPAGDTLAVDRALAFLEAYREAGGPVGPSNALIPLIRDRLRHGVAFWSWVRDEGHDVDPADIRGMTAAFARLRSLRLPV